jgi:SRSO17 transposase
MAALAAVVADLTAELPVARTLTVADLDGLIDELRAYHAHFAPCFARRDQRAGVELYLRGLLTADVPRKNIEAMALRLQGAGPAADRQVRALQYCLSAGAWDDDALLTVQRHLVADTLGEADGVLLIDGSDIPKQGQHSAGVARQWCGATGKRDNCQAGVFLGYASRRGYTLLDRGLYLPAGWFEAAARERWVACGIPDGTPFRTKQQLAARLVERALADQTLPAQWAVCDEQFGDDQDLRDQLARQGLWYLAEVACATRLWPLVEPDGQTPRPRPQTWVPPRTASRKGPAPRRARLHPASPATVPVAEWASQVPPDGWQRYRILEGSKGPLVAEFVTVRAVLVRDRLPGPEGWLVVRRTLPTAEAAPVYKYYLSNAPADTPLPTLVRVSGLRWPIESCFTEGKGELGRDHYELRSWRGWHHHMTLVILAHFFLVRLQQRLNRREGGQRSGQCPAARPGGLAGGGRDAGAGAAGGGAAELGRGGPAAAGAAAAAGVGRGRGAGLGGLPAAAQDGRLPLASPAAAP